MKCSNLSLLATGSRHGERKKATEQNGPSFILLLAWASSPGVSGGIPDPR